MAGRSIEQVSLCAAGGMVGWGCGATTARILPDVSYMRGCLRAIPSKQNQRCCTWQRAEHEHDPFLVGKEPRHRGCSVSSTLCPVQMRQSPRARPPPGQHSERTEAEDRGRGCRCVCRLADMKSEFGCEAASGAVMLWWPLVEVAVPMRFRKCVAW